MAGVYSHRFYAGNYGSGTPTTVYTTPAGYRALVKSIALSIGVQLGGGSGHVIGPGDAIMAQQFNGDPVSNPTTYLFFGSWVLEAGEAILVHTDGGSTWGFHIAGYQLVLP